jgi:hypothetical protein
MYCDFINLQTSPKFICFRLELSVRQFLDFRLERCDAILDPFHVLFDHFGIISIGYWLCTVFGDWEPDGFDDAVEETHPQWSAGFAERDHIPVATGWFDAPKSL